MDLNAIYRRSVFWISDFLKGSPVGNPYKEIKFIQEHSYDEGLPIRMEALHRLMEYAKKNSPFYKNVDARDLNSFPIMNKSSLLEHFNEIKVAEANIPGQQGPVHVQTTSGSTGTPFRIPQDTRKRNRRIAELKYFGKIVGFNSHDKLIHLRTWNKWQQKTPAQIKKENIIPFDIARMDDEHLRKLCELTASEKAICLRGYASSLGKMVEYANGKGYKFPYLKIAIAGAESLQDDVRALYKQVTKSEIISQYANEECGIMAQEKVPTKETDNPMYWNYSGYFFEVLKFDSDEPAAYGELGRIVITDLYNYAFPLIRYDNGDTAIIDAPNAWSRGYPILKKLYGRRFDLTYSTTGTAIFPLTYGRILKHFDNIAQWQFVQNGQNDYELKVIMRKKGEPLDSVLSELKEYLGEDAKISINVVDDIPVLASGKRKPVVNNWKK